MERSTPARRHSSRVAAVSTFPEPLRTVSSAKPLQSTNSKWWLAAGGVAVCGALVGGYLVYGPQTSPPNMNQEILIDTSEGMSAPFDAGLTKLNAAVAALVKRGLHPTENLALREFGGECGTKDESRLLVSFGRDRREEINSVAGKLKPRGQPAMVSGIKWAIDDVSRLSNTKRVIVLTGHADKCDVEEPLTQIRRALDAAKLDPKDLKYDLSAWQCRQRTSVS